MAFFIGGKSGSSHRVTLPLSFPTTNANPPVIPYSEVTNEIGNLLSTRCRVGVFIGIFEAQSRGE